MISISLWNDLMRVRKYCSGAPHPLRHPMSNDDLTFFTIITEISDQFAVMIGHLSNGRLNYQNQACCCFKS